MARQLQRKRPAPTPSVWIATALGKDRPGIVAQVTKILYKLGCNLEDSAMTRLGGEFAIMVAFSSPATVSRAAIERAFKPLARLRLVTHLKPLSRDEITAGAAGSPYLLTVYGADRPGIVYRVSELLAELRVNITDVSTHRTTPSARAASQPLYLMLLELELPKGLATRDVERHLHKLASELGVEVSLRSAEASVL